MPDTKIQIIVEAKDKATKALGNISKSLGAAGEKMRRSSLMISDSAKIASTAVGGTLVAAIGASVKAAIDFEDSFAGIRKTVDASEADFRRLAQNIRSLAKETPTTTTDLNRIGELAGQLGVSGVANLTKFIDTIAKISVTTNLTTESASLDFARIATVMEEPIDNIDRMASIVVDLGNNFATTEMDIVEFAKRIAGAGAISGLATSDIFAIGTAMSTVGIQAEAGGTAVQKVLLSMKDAAVGTGEGLATFAETAGMSASQFTKAFQDDAAGAFEAFVLGLSEAGDDAILILDDLELKDQRLLRAFLSLAESGDILTKTLNKSNDAWVENSALTTEAEKRFETTASQIVIARNKINDLAISIGEKLLPHVNTLLDKFGVLIDETLPEVARLLGENKEATFILASALALTLAPAIVASIGHLAGLALALLPFTLLGAITAAALLGINELSKAITGFTLLEQVQASVEIAKNAFTDLVGFLNWVRDTFSATIELTKIFIGVLDDLFDISGKVKDHLDPIVDSFNNIKGSGAFGEAAKSGLKTIISAITGFNIPGLQHGGIARAGQPHIVGEAGPELFIPGETGRVEPNLGGSTTLNMTVNVGMFAGTALEKRRIAEELMEEFRFLARSRGQTTLEAIAGNTNISVG